MARLDPHSYADDSQPVVHRLEWDAKFDLDARVIDATATLLFKGPAEGPLDLDTRDLAVQSVERVGGGNLKWQGFAADPVLGARLQVEVPRGTEGIRITYRTHPRSSALQWLEAKQTKDGHPFLFSQCQAIHARSVVPVPDTPRQRITFRARLDVPKALRGLMAAAFVSREELGDRAIETYEMPQPIPPYLLAFAVGRLESRELGPRSRVWAEPSTVEQAAWEFAQVDAMLTAAEKLFGPYDWDRFDLLVMPPSFPYGGMENPRLTFLTPTLLAGDRSLVDVVAHELAHSWTGNLVTNANAEHFWLNEGWTVYAERRIVEALEGADRAELGAALGRRTLEREIERFSGRPALTRLHTHLAGVDPDDAFSSVPYEKGYLFLRLLERTVGRAAFDTFVRAYIDTFRFRSITTDEFTAFVEAQLPGVLAKVDASKWIDGEGVPANAPLAESARLKAIEALGSNVPPKDAVAGWTPAEWQVYLPSLPTPPPAGLAKSLDETHALATSTNAEILAEFLRLGIASGYAPAIDRAKTLLGQVGRMKYLRPLYAALNARPQTKPLARELFAKYGPTYHPIAQQVIGGILK